MKPLNIKAVFDGRPGHEKQTEGIIRALNKITPVNVSKIQIRSGVKDDIVAWIRVLLSWIMPSKKKGDCDLIIGTGTHTHPHVLRLGRLFKARKVICMSPGKVISSFFDLCFVPEHDGFTIESNIKETVGPPNLSTNTGKHEDGKGLILIGGIDQKSHKWDSEEILGYVKSIVEIDSETDWSISTSPRTPDQMIPLLDELASGEDRVSFYPFSETPRGWVEKKYDISRNVWVTSDSMSMVYEALSSGCRVGLIPVEWKKSSGKFARGEKALLSRRLVTSFDEWRSSHKMASGDKILNEADSCARAILNYWWPERM